MRALKTADEMYDISVASELVDASRMAAIREGHRKTGCVPADAMECAQLLVCEGILTQFQAQLLMQGKWKNFFLGSKYKVMDQLGAGGMGTVFLCEHRYMRRRVAIKILPPEKNHSQHTIDRFYREAQAIARLDHPNIVRAHDIGHHGPALYIVMELVEGANFETLIQLRGALNAGRAVNYVMQAANGLQHAHDQGLVHRDVKPANLLVDGNGLVKVLDLGLARFSGDSSHDPSGDRGVLGTADYISPEQAVNASSADNRSDIYSLGCTLYFLLTGRPPFDGGSVAQKLIWHQSAEPDPVHLLNPMVPVALSECVSHMMAKSPVDRPQSAYGVVHLLRPWYVPVPPPTADEMPAKQFGHHGDVDPAGRTMAGNRTLGGTASTASLARPMIANASR